MLSAPPHRYSLNRYEQTLRHSTVGPERLRSLAAGISRFLRLSKALEEEHLKTIWDTAASVAGPVFFFFVYWVLETAKKQGIKRLYFLSRDGKIFLEIAETIKKYWPYNIDCRYLYSSRELWNSAYETAAVIGYLKEEQLAANPGWGIVDIGWIANAQFSLSKILEANNLRPAAGLTGFYFGLSENKVCYKNDRLLPFMFDLSQSFKNHALRCNGLYETFAASEEGRVKTIRREADKFLPVLDQSAIEATRKWGVAVQRESILKFAEECGVHYAPEPIEPAILKSLAQNILQKFVPAPDFREAKTYGQFTLEADAAGQTVIEIAPHLGLSGLGKFLFGIRKIDCLWSAGSLSRSSWPFKRLINQLAHLKNLCRIIFFRYLNPKNQK